MKKEYVIGGLSAAVLCAVIAYAIMTFTGTKDSVTDVQVVPLPEPLEVVQPATRQTAKDQPADQEQAPEAGQTGGGKAAKQKEEGTSGIMITLKSGKVILADTCREFGSSLNCDLPGGPIEIERQDIESMKDVTILKRSSAETVPASGSPEGTDNKNETGKSAAASNKNQKPDEGKLIKDFTPEQIKRLDEITARKAVLKPERERLIKDREKLHEDVKNAGVIRSQVQLDEINGRIADLEKTITNFNDEVKKLNEEETMLLDAGRNK